MPRKATTKTPAEDPVLLEAPSVTIAGVVYPIRRLGLRDVFRVSRILGRGVAMLTDAKNVSGGQVVQVLVASLSQNEEEVLSLIADVLGVKRVDLNDAERFPMDSVIDVFEALSKHQDLVSFLTRVQTLAERLPEMQTP